MVDIQNFDYLCKETITGIVIIDFHTHRPIPPEVVAPHSFGIHPWHAGEASLSSISASCWQAAELIGECGLDCCKGPSLDIQTDCFERQIAIAERLEKPMVIHCVRAQDTLLRLRGRHMKTPWVMHGFAGGLAQARQLMQKGIGISVGPALLRPDKSKLREAVRSLGSGAFFLETDDTGADIFELYRVAAQLLDTPLADLEYAISVRYNHLLHQRGV
ncbi:MAG: TatD family hydrolase [Bacteroidales bacterium]|nr:TatD family hydrolase [Bacteroidales bacterium]